MVIATGQQAGTFGGPIFTLLKALTAIKLARAVEATHGVPAVPVFWVDAEDHDWNEVAGCTVLDAELTPKTVGVGAAPRTGSCPISSLPLSPGAAATVLAALREALPPTEFTDTLIASLARHYGDGVTLARAFAGVMDDLLGPLGLVVYDASDPATKPLAGPLFVRELSSPGETSRLAAAAGAALDARGYKAQVTPGPRSDRAVRAGRDARADAADGARRLHHRRSPGERRRPGRRGDGPSRALQPERAAAAARPGHALPDHRLRRRPERGRPTSPS